MAHARKIITHDIQLNLSMEEAELVKALMGAVAAGGISVGVYDALLGAGVIGGGYKITAGHDRLPVYCLHLEKK